MEKDNQRIIDKIKKLMALAKSPNPHEAARALEMAQKLMERHALREEDVVISEKDSEVEFAKRTPIYVHYLTAVISRAFGCEAYFAAGFKAKAVFFGQDERPEIAAYCFDVLFRKLSSARREYLTTRSNKRLKRSTLIARADAFCEGWVSGVRRNVKEFAMTPEEKGKLERHLTRLRASENMTKGSSRSVGNTHEKNGDNSRHLGYLEGGKCS